MGFEGPSKCPTVGNKYPILWLIGPQAECKVKANRVKGLQHILWTPQTCRWYMHDPPPFMVIYNLEVKASFNCLSWPLVLCWTYIGLTQYWVDHEAFSTCHVRYHADFFHLFKSLWSLTPLGSCVQRIWTVYGFLTKHINCLSWVKGP